MLKQVKICKISWIVLSLLMLSSPAFSIEGDGTHTGGGGDYTESVIFEIRATIREWIKKGGSRKLELPNKMTVREYNRKMLAVLKPHAVVVSVVTAEEERNTSDPELKVIVDGEPKSCRGFISEIDKRRHILCNSDRFPEDPTEQYRQIHHEFAGLAGVEHNQGASSDYSISNKVKEYVEPETVWGIGFKKRKHFGKNLSNSLDGTWVLAGYEYKIRTEDNDDTAILKNDLKLISSKMTRKVPHVTLIVGGDGMTFIFTEDACQYAHVGTLVKERGRKAFQLTEIDRILSGCGGFQRQQAVSIKRLWPIYRNGDLLEVDVDDETQIFRRL